MLNNWPCDVPRSQGYQFNTINTSYSVCCCACCCTCMYVCARCVVCSLVEQLTASTTQCDWHSCWIAVGLDAGSDSLLASLFGWLFIRIFIRFVACVCTRATRCHALYRNNILLCIFTRQTGTYNHACNYIN